VNPVQGTRVNPRAPEPALTYAYTMDEIQQIIAVLPEPAATAFATAAYSGLRRGEVEALEWQDYHDGCLHVSRSVWNGRVTAAKTRASCAAVPVIPQLALRLDMHKLRAGNPVTGPMFANSLGNRLSINNMQARFMLPALNRCVVCGKPGGKAHLSQNHDWRRDESIPQWHGWHAARRGLGSNLYRLGVPDKIIQAILRHANVSITLGYYVKTVSSDVSAAMAKLETAAQTRDSAGTVNVASGVIQ